MSIEQTTHKLHLATLYFIYSSFPFFFLLLLDRCCSKRHRSAMIRTASRQLVIRNGKNVAVLNISWGRISPRQQSTGQHPYAMRYNKIKSEFNPNFGGFQSFLVFLYNVLFFDELHWIYFNKQMLKLLIEFHLDRLLMVAGFNLKQHHTVCSGPYILYTIGQNGKQKFMAHLILKLSRV